MSASVTFTPFKGEPGVYFERVAMTNIISSTWSLVNFVDLKPIRQEAKLTQSYVKGLTEICKSINSTTLCQGTVDQLAHQAEMLYTRNLLLLRNPRQKRGAINVVGNIAGTLFGLLDSEYAEKLSVTIENLKSNDESLKTYVENQTMFLDRTLTIMKRSEEKIKMEFEALEDLITINKNRIKKVSDEVHREQLTTNFNMLAMQAFMQATRFISVQDALIDILTDSHHGKINPELLTPNELQAQLHAINTFTTKNAQLPLLIDDVANYIRIMTISHQITDNYIIINMKIPLIAAKQFELLKLTAIPWSSNNSLFKLDLATPYILVDLLREHHVPLSTDQLQTCLTVDNAIYFCPQTQPIQNANSTSCNCVMSILRTAKIHSNCHPIRCTEEPYWRRLHSPNNWLVAVKSNELVSAVCDNTPNHLEISGSGILKIRDGCTVKTTTVTIEGHEEKTSTRQIVYIPACNVTKVKLKPERIEFESSKSSYKLNADIGYLQKELHNIKTISLNKINPHDVHHYGLSYTLLILIVGCLIYMAWLHLKQKRLRRKTHPKTCSQTTNAATNVYSC